MCLRPLPSARLSCSPTERPFWLKLWLWEMQTLSEPLPLGISQNAWPAGWWGSYVNTFNFLVLPLGHFPFGFFIFSYWNGRQRHAHRDPLHVGATGDCCVSHGYAHEIRAFYLWLCAYYPWLITGSSCFLLFSVLCCIFLVFFLLVAFIFVFFWVSSFWAVKCDICNTLPTYCWPAERLLGPSACLGYG